MPITYEDKLYDLRQTLEDKEALQLLAELEDLVRERIEKAEGKYDERYDRGYEIGHDEGYREGYDKGLAEEERK